jgi:lysophospholipase L1-like esterase
MKKLNTHTIRFTLLAAFLVLNGPMVRAAEDDRPVLDDAKFGADKPATSGQSIPSLFIVGDSTVKNGSNGGRGWGEVIGKYFDAKKINVINRAIGGRSARSYTFEGKWDRVLSEMKPGDFVLIQFGHNDWAAVPYNDPKSKWRSPLKGDGDETAEFDRPGADGKPSEKEIVRTYGGYLRKFGNEAKAKGATVIFCSMVPHKDFDAGGKVKRGERTSLVAWMRHAAEKTGSLVLDLNEIVAEGYEELGPQKVEAFFADARTHTTQIGAEYTAEKLIGGLKGTLAKNPLEPFLSDAGKAVKPVTIHEEPATQPANKSQGTCK